MNKFYNVTINITKDSELDSDSLSYIAINEFEAIGCSLYDMSEAELDHEFGDETLCGGNPDDHFIEKIEDFSQKRDETIQISFADDSKRTSFIEFLKSENIEFKLEDVEDEDWNKTWRDSFQKIVISENFEIIPSWEEFSNSQKQLKIYPGMGFGTGTHETTYLSLVAMTRLYQFGNNQNLSVLDFGAGSGILGLSAQKIYNASVEYVDIDSDAKVNAEQNHVLNFNSGNLHYVLRNQFKTSKQYDLVFANILLGVLLEEKDVILKCLKPGGFLITSGILINQIDELINAYPLTVVEKYTKNDWGCVVFKK